jgi:hypothetical protein
MRSSPLADFLLAGLVVAASLPAQAPTPEQSAAVAAALRQFAQAFDAGQLSPRGNLRGGAERGPEYLRSAKTSGALDRLQLDRLTHMDVVQKLLYLAEQSPSAEMADAVLAIAAAGYGKSLTDRDALELRDLGHWSLMRMEDRGVWYQLMRAAAGERPAWLPAPRSDAPLDFGKQVAALLLLGRKAQPVFRSTVEAALTAADARVRLAAVEALTLSRRGQSLPVLLRAMGSERHPIVSQALVRAVTALLGAANDVPKEQRAEVVAGALRLLGVAGWRTDMDLIALIEAFPQKAAIPELIAVLERSRAEPDKLLAAVNKRAPPLLRERAYAALRALTGAILPIDKPGEWRAFWLQEKDNIVVPEKIVRQQQGNTRAAFFGIPVVGSEVAFLIDTSGSMDEVCGTVTERGRQQGRERLPTRLDTAKTALLSAVQAMDRDTRYHLITFDSEVKTWNKKPVPPTAEATRSLHEMLGQFKAHGGTNIFGALALALQAGELRFGETGKQTVDEIFVLSDGEPTTGEVKDPDAILALIHNANQYQKVRINTVFVGSGAGAEFLRRLAAENDGVFVQR